MEAEAEEDFGCDPPVASLSEADRPKEHSRTQHRPTISRDDACARRPDQGDGHAEAGAAAGTPRSAVFDTAAFEAGVDRCSVADAKGEIFHAARHDCDSGNREDGSGP